MLSLSSSDAYDCEISPMPESIKTSAKIRKDLLSNIDLFASGLLRCFTAGMMLGYMNRYVFNE
jgi:hypothetical protein